MDSLSLAHDTLPLLMWVALGPTRPYSLCDAVGNSFLIFRRSFSIRYPPMCDRGLIGFGLRLSHALAGRQRPRRTCSAAAGARRVPLRVDGAKSVGDG